MKGLADFLSLVVIVLVVTTILCGIGTDTFNVAKENIGGDILDVSASRGEFGYTRFLVTLDLDNGSVVVCSVQSDKLGGTLYRLYRNRKPELPRLRETARVQVGRHSGSVVCRGLAITESNEAER